MVVAIGEACGASGGSCGYSGNRTAVIISTTVSKIMAGPNDGCCSCNGSSATTMVVACRKKMDQESALTL